MTPLNLPSSMSTWPSQSWRKVELGGGGGRLQGSSFKAKLHEQVTVNPKQRFAFFVLVGLFAKLRKASISIVITITS